MLRVWKWALEIGPNIKCPWEPMTVTLQGLSLVEKAGLVQVLFTLCLRDQWNVWMQDACKVYMDSCMASNGSCFMVTLTIFKIYLLEVGLTRKPGAHGTPNAHNSWIILFYHVWWHAWVEFNEIAFGEGSNQTWLHTTLEGPWPYYMILEVSWDGLWTLSFGLSQFHGHGSWLMCEVALNPSFLKSNCLHFDIFRFSFINLRYIL